MVLMIGGRYVNEGVDVNQKCAAGIKFENGSCISLDLLLEMVNAYNKDCDTKNCKINIDKINKNNLKKELLGEFKNKLKVCGDNQTCWINQKFVKNLNSNFKNHLQKNTFRPVGPDGKNEWLNTNHINDLVGQYENKYPDFKFFGAVAMDFDNVPQYGIKNADFNQLRKNGKTKFGFVMNLDEHWQSGSHWVSLYADTVKGEISYFDSYGYKPDNRIYSLVKRIGMSCRENGIEPRIKINKSRAQFKNSECGVYSANFIIRCLQGTNPVDIALDKVPDDNMVKCRKEYFR